MRSRMMIFLQKSHLLLILTCEFFGIRDGSSQDLSGNCTFDQPSLCSWSNDKHTDHFDWLLWQGSTPDNNKGPASDHSGDGSYIYIDTSHPRKYDEKARLNSPWMRGAQRMTFYYSMYGGTVESLSVFVRINGSEERIWSRYGNHALRNWTKGCVSINFIGTYQIIMEAVAGVTYASNIAVDDLTFSTNLTCFSVGKPTPSEIFEVNCTFDKNYCGWRNMLTSLDDQITWYRKKSGNQSQGTGPSHDHTGGGLYIFIEKSKLAQGDQSAQLLSPLIRGPKCLRFYYYMNGSDIGNLDVLLWPRRHQDNYLIWRESGQQGDEWVKASVDVGYTGESQVVLQATLGRNYTEGIAIDDVTVTDGLCDEEIDLQSSPQGNCDFDSHICFWRNDVNFNFEWTRRRYSTPNRFTGPNADHTSGYGMYIYIEASLPQIPGDTARLESPWMRGPQCMTFYYHMYGSTMSCVVIYIRRIVNNKLKPVWLKSQDRGEGWLQGQISINETSSYQIIIDGIRGNSYLGDAALDDFSFRRGTCQETGTREEVTYYVSSFKGKDFRISTEPSEHSLYSEEFRFTLEHPRGNPNETPYFIYSQASDGESFIQPKLDVLADYTNFPLGVVVLNNEELRQNSRRVYMIERSQYGPMISLDEHEIANCCKAKLNSSFYAYNVTESGNRSISGCKPGWFKATNSCYLFYFQSTSIWRNARSVCHRLGADLVVVNNEATVEFLAKQRKEMKLDGHNLYVGLSSNLRWIWLDGENVSDGYNLWGPGQPDGDGRCGTLLNYVIGNLKWLGYGWRWNDFSCTRQQYVYGYICEQPLAVPLPMALFLLSGTNGTVDRSPNGATKAVSYNIKLAPGPYGNPNGSSFFSGDESSYVELKNTGELDTRFSISVFAWIHLDNSDGPIFEYGCSMWVSHLTLGIEVRYMDRKTSNIYLLHKESVLVANAWNFIGTTYDYHTGIATVWVNNNTVMLRSIGAEMELATQSDVRVGASSRNQKRFRGRISCIQFYDQALSVDQITEVKARCNNTTTLACNSNFFPFHGGCFSITKKYSITWKDALSQCRLVGGTLAKISREGLRYAFSKLLEKQKPVLYNVHIGLTSRDDWVWIDGSPLNASFWMPGYPTVSSEIPKSCAVLSAGSSRLKNVYCGYTRYPLCQKKSDNSLSQRSLTQSSSVLLDYNPSLVIDRSYTTCFRSQKESNPWWRVTLEKPLYVESVVITDKIDCCPRDIGMIKVTVSTNQTGDLSCKKSLKYGATHHYKVRCSPPARGSYVTVTLTGDNVTLVLCYVVIKTFEFVRDARGVLREGWYGVNYNSKISPTMRDNPSFKSAVESEIILRDFEAPVNLGENYIQQLTSYLQVPESGYYTFYVSCDDFCELWKHDANIFEEDDKKTENSRQPIVTVKRSTWHRQWNKYPAQMSQSILLDKCRLYRMEAFMRGESGDDHISVGMRRPNGEYERPIPGTRLFWTKPGTRRLEVTLRDQKTLLSGFVGSDLRISGFYRFCCEGVYCPDCPLELNISTLGQNVTVNSALNLSCVNISFMATFNTERQPGDSAMKVTYSFVENTEKIVYQRVLGNVHLQVVELNECNFEYGFCGWTSIGENDKWKLSSDKTFIKYPAHFAYIDGRYQATLVSPALPWKPFHQSVGLCLRFNYVLPAKSKSSLKVLLRGPNQGNPLSIWQLAGYHGEEWSAAQVAFPGVKNVQIIVEGEGFLDNEINVAVDDVIVLTENCSLRPYYAEPGFSCADTQFTCKNGECVKRNLLCDGYRACKDGSDEDDCECPFSMFQCQGGGCLLSTEMCNGVSDCINRDDENNCRNPCPSSYQCPDGTCISWSNTCSKTPFCLDGTNTPSVCEYGNCHLNDLACISKNSSGNQRCKSFRGHCSFESENCGLKTDKNATLYWTVGSAQRTRESTGPSYDHTLFNEDGSYIFIDASNKNPGDKARLLSGWMEANQDVCLQFWYHMHGLGIGNLSIFMKTNQTETLVWRLSGDQGKRWRFGQTALNNPSLYKFVIEGTVGAGNAGDIALDDLTVYDGICETITRQASPDCDFDEGMCDWDAQEGWSLDKRLVNRFEKRGGFVASLPGGASDLPSFLSSPVINSHAYEWKCLRFWYFIGSDDVDDWYTASLMVNVRAVTSNQTILLFFEDEVTNKAQYTQIPLPSNYTNAQIDFVGWSKYTVGPSLAVDDVSFSKELCQQIPWKPIADPVGPLKCQEALGMETGTICDGQISASSQLDVNHAAKQGRLHCKTISQNSWSAGKNDVHQWLQVDLGSQYTKVTRVATQGRHDAAQWVTKYKLAYSNDGVNFQYHREQGQTVDKNFTGNTDQDTVVYHELNPPIRARYIRFGPEAWQGHISMRVELYGCLEECQEPLGMENGAISNGQITASSEWDVNHAAIQGRLNFQGNQYKKGSWSARGSNKNQWLQVDLGSEYTKVTRVATQGRHDYPQWVTKYKLQYSTDGVNFQFYREQRQTEDKEFAGNTDQETVVFHELKPAIKARYVRFRPEDWLAHVSMRVELYGCQEVCHEAMGMKDGAISDGQITASSQYDSNHAPFQGRLDFTKWKGGSWSASKNDLHQWLQVDLGNESTKVTRVATQGRNDYNQWVTKYKLQYRNDGANFQYYREQGQTVDKNFAGNNDRDTVVYHYLNPPIKSRYVRFRPVAWHGHVSMRVELYGCQEGTVGDCLNALGMENGTISDGQISASSQWTADYAAVQGRLHFKAISNQAESWSAGKNDLHQWLQVDLGSQYTKVTRLATQGRHDYPQWVTKYKLKYSNDGVNFQFYREQGLNADKDFTGNTDQDTVVFHALNPPIKARYIRFQPEAWRGWISMRVELYGCVECQETLESSAASDAQITTSSQLDADHPAIRGRLQCESTSSKEGSWSAGYNDENQWLQVDLGSRYTKVTRVATQGILDAAQWVTKYKLQYSNDEVNFQYYREKGETGDKQFVGNADQDSVVSHELNPPIRARYVRFRPEAWHNHISMRVKLYGCQDDIPCDISVDWCGWKSVRGWKRIKYQELDKVYQEDDGNNDDGEDEKVVSDNERIFDPGNYEIDLPDVDLGYLSLYDIAHLHVGFTLCFWLKTEHSGFFIEYKVAKEQDESLLLGVYCLNNSVSTQLANKRSEVAMGVADDTWHHVCLSWLAERGSLAIFKDGERKYQSDGFWSSSKHLGIQGGGTMTIGFRARNKNASVVLGTLSGFNVWSYEVSAEEILRMSHGCGDESGDVKAWETVKRGLKKEVAVKWSRTCNDRKGDRLVVDTNAAGFGQSAVLVSPPYNRSRDWHSKCLKFRYMLRGPGKKKVTVYQKIKSYREIPIWISRRNNDQDWSYGQVPLSAVSEFQVLIKAETEKKEDLIAVTGLYFDEETHCTHQPLLAKQACSENLFNLSGYFFSPSFPGYYLDDMFCTWHITVPSGYVIHLELQEFRLRDHPTCENCFLQIFDGRDVTGPSIGRFCGYDYPPVFVSSTNHFTIVLLCRENFPKGRFKALYHSVTVHDDAGSSCSRQQEWSGCPSGCECEEIGIDPNKKILVTGKDLRSVPSNLPSQTGAVFFQQNRISRLREKDFANLTKLEYIDMSFNILLHLEEECFKNVSSVETLRLNSNFFRSLPVGAFAGLPNLRVLDLGRNFLHKAVSGMFDGLANLEVLSMRSNQLRELKYGVFDNKGNLTHLYLQDNTLSTLPDGLFGALSKLKVLNLSSNELRAVTKKTFQGLKSIEYMYLDRNKLSEVPSDAFSDLTNLKYLKLDRFILCCYAKKSIVGVDCESPVDEFSSCEDLMKNKTLQICIWILGILAFLGNLLVIIWRIIDKEENRVNSFLLTNLAVADMFMGVYMLTIAIMDLRWRGNYFMHDINWRSGIGCQIAGALSMLSSEVSVLILTIITLDRLISIVFPFKFNRLTYKTAFFACIWIWVFGVVISLIPITGLSYFYDESGHFGFYSRSAVCLSLQLSEGRPAGWEYSVAFFVCLNFISFTFILVAYMTMFWTVKRASRAARSTNLNKESAMAKRLVFIVMTDFCCWMPIIIINILSLTGNFDDPDKIAYVWIAVFVLPLNSSLNPILYTFSTDRTKRNMNRKRKNVVSLVMQSLNSHGLVPKQRQLNWQKLSGDSTLLSNVIGDFSPQSSIAETQEGRGRKQKHAKLRLIENVKILQDDIAGKRSTGYVTAWWEEGNILRMVLLKYFGKGLKEDWIREVEIVRGLSSREEPHARLLHYCWHSKAHNQNIEHGNVRIQGFYSNSFLICYDFVSSSTLEDFLSKKGTVLNFDAVCAIACDVISAIERLQDFGILHNNITTSNILIEQIARLPPIRAVLGGFSQASKSNEAGAFKNLAAYEHSNYSNDIKQFGQLLATLLGYCHGSSEYTKLHEIMNLCFEEPEEKRHEASYIRGLLEEAWSADGVWDTYL